MQREHLQVYLTTRNVSERCCNNDKSNRLYGVLHHVAPCYLQRWLAGRTGTPLQNQEQLCPVHVPLNGNRA